MKRSDHSAAIGLCASLVVHAGVLAALLVFYVKDMDARQWWMSAAEADARRGRAEAIAPREADRLVYRDGEFGETKGKGEAMNSLEGDEAYMGRLGPQDQAPLSRDPVGNGKLAEEPVVTALKEQAVARVPASIAGSEGASAPFGVESVQREAGPKVVVKPPIKAIAIEEKGAAPLEADRVPVVVSQEQKPVEKEAQVAVSPTPQKTAEANPGQRAGEGKVQAPAGAATEAVAANTGGAPGDPAPMSESESDAFSRIGSINVKNGKVEARLGRSFKSVKPRLSLKGELDAISIAKPIVEMKVLVDETGKVIDVKVLRSSGSNEIDLPTTTAMYKWWIEPARDKQGKAMKDVILVTFSYL
jgi:TonB family protein